DFYRSQHFDLAFHIAQHLGRTLNVFGGAVFQFEQHDMLDHASSPLLFVELEKRSLVGSFENPAYSTIMTDTMSAWPEPHMIEQCISYRPGVSNVISWIGLSA